MTSETDSSDCCGNCSGDDKPSSVNTARVLRDSLCQRVAEFIDAKGVFSRGQAILLGVSGGADSVAMLAVMQALASVSDFNYRICIAHLDHGLRDESAADAEFVRQLAEVNQLPCELKRVNVAEKAAQSGESFEQQARQCRYDFFISAAKSMGCSAVAVAHHSDDQVETLLHRIIRGCGVEALAAMAASRPLDDAGGISLARPMLAATRSDIEQFIARHGLSVRLDHTNSDTSYTRNRLRHKLLPFLREHFNPSVDAAVLRLSENAARCGEILADQANAKLAELSIYSGSDQIELDLAAFDELSAAMAAQVVRQGVLKLAGGSHNLGADHFDAIVNAPRGGGVQLPGGLRAHRRQGRLIISRDCEPMAASAGGGDESCEIELLSPGKTYLPDGSCMEITAAASEEAGDIKQSPAPSPAMALRRVLTERIDAEKLCGKLTLRRRRPGDRFHPLGAAGAKKLKDFFNDQAIEARHRDAAWLLCDEKSIVWVVGLRIADRVKITSETRDLLRLNFTPK